jgi:hypothetical protein
MNTLLHSKRSFSRILSVIVSIPAIAGAVPLDFAPADTLLAVQASGGEGASKNVLVNLGPSVAFRDGTNPAVLGNISTDLSNTFGSNWFSRTDLFFGVYANRTNSRTDAGTGTQDTQRVVYVSRATSTPGAGASWGTFSLNGLANASTFFVGVKGIFGSESYADPLTPRLEITPTTTNATILSETAQSERWLNSWTAFNPPGGPAFGTWAGGIENSFGQGGSRVLVDVQRLQPGVAATYVVTIAIESDGTIRALEPSAPSTPFDTWVATFPALVNSPNAADRTPAGDFDNDGVPNTREFAFGGSPVSAFDNGQQQIHTVDANADTLRDFTQTVEVRSGATFTPSGNKLTATVDGITYTIEGSLDLVTFESPVSEVTPTLGTGSPKSGYVFKTFRLNAGNGLSGKGFIRAGASVNAS